MKGSRDLMRAYKALCDHTPPGFQQVWWPKARCLTPTYSWLAYPQGTFSDSHPNFSSLHLATFRITKASRKNRSGNKMLCMKSIDWTGGRRKPESYASLPLWEPQISQWIKDSKNIISSPRSSCTISAPNLVYKDCLQFNRFLEQTGFNPKRRN
jgi:hypothetical protein